MAIHFPHIAHKKTCLVAARSRTDFKNNVLFVERVWRNELELELLFNLRLFLLKALELLSRHFFHIHVIFGGNHQRRLFNAAQHFFVFRVNLHQLRQMLMLAHNIFVFLLVFDKFRVLHHFACFLETCGQFFEFLH